MSEEGEEYTFSSTTNNRYLTVEDCFNNRHSCREDICERIKSNNNDIKEISIEFKDALEGIRNELKEVTNSVNKAIVAFALAMLGFAGAIVAALVALFVIFL